MKVSPGLFQGLDGFLRSLSVVNHGIPGDFPRYVSEIWFRVRCWITGFHFEGEVVLWDGLVI